MSEDILAQTRREKLLLLKERVSLFSCSRLVPLLALQPHSIWVCLFSLSLSLSLPLSLFLSSMPPGPSHQRAGDEEASLQESRGALRRTAGAEQGGFDFRVQKDGKSLINLQGS